MRLRKSDSTMEDTTRRAQEQIYAARMRAEKELDRATKQADRALSKSKQSMGQNPLLFGAIAGTALVGGVAAWMFNRKRPSGNSQRRQG